MRKSLVMAAFFGAQVALATVAHAQTTRVVFWWGDYIRSDGDGYSNPVPAGFEGRIEIGDNKFRGSHGSRIENIDLDGDGVTTDDQIVYHAFSMSNPLNPPGPESGLSYWGYHSGKPSARFYGGMVGRYGNYKPVWVNPNTGQSSPLGFDQASVEGAEGANPGTFNSAYPHNVPRGQAPNEIGTEYSDIAVFPFSSDMLFPWSTTARFPKNDADSSDDLARFSAIFMWKKHDFLGGGDAADKRVVLDSSSRMSIDVTRYWYGIETARWVVQDGDDFWVSEASFDRSTGGVDNTLGKTNELDPTSTRWALWDPSAIMDPKDPGYMNFDTLGAVYDWHTFEDVQAFGFYLEKDAFTRALSAFVVDHISLDATLVAVPEPAGLSILGLSLLALRRKRC